MVTEIRTQPRVLILATRVPLESGDGDPSFVLDNAVALRNEFDISIIAPRVSGAPKESSHAGVRVLRFAYFPRRWERLANEAIMPQLTRSPLLWLQAFALVTAMCITALNEHRRCRFDVVHAQWIIPSGLTANILHKLTNAPYLITSHGADAFRLSAGPFRRLKRRIINQSRRFVAVSRDIATCIDGVTVPIEIQPTGVDFTLWERLVGERRPTPGKVLFVGRLATKKGVATLIEAIAGVEGVDLTVVGDGPLRGELERLARNLDVAHRVDFLGNCTRVEVAEEMRTAACIAIPSVTSGDGDRDGTPNVLGEAVAAGVPIVGSRIAGIAEYLADGRTGVLFTPGDMGELRDRIREVLDMHDPRPMTRAARAELVSDLDIKQVARRYADWYRSAMATGGVD